MVGKYYTGSNRSPFALDSPNPAALEKALEANKNGKPITNSITDAKVHFNAVLPLATK